MRKAKVFYKEDLAGVLTETDEGLYEFQYDREHIEQRAERFLTFTMPVRIEPYFEKRLFPFFEGLIPEGWLLDVATKSWKINPNDRMGLLLACCKDCIGAVSIQAFDENE